MGHVADLENCSHSSLYFEAYTLECTPESSRRRKKGMDANGPDPMLATARLVAKPASQAKDGSPRRKPGEMVVNHSRSPRRGRETAECPRACPELVEGSPALGPGKPQNFMGTFLAQSIISTVTAGLDSTAMAGWTRPLWLGLSRSPLSGQKTVAPGASLGK